MLFIFNKSERFVIPLLVVFFNCLPCFSQQETDDKIKYQKNTETNRLFPGDSISLGKWHFNSLRNYNKDTLRLSDFRSRKLIILDFWTKYCTYCIAAMPRMEELQSKFDSDIQIILVTKNRQNELYDLFNKSTILKNVKLPIIMEDSILFTKVFKHNTNPYHVWLSGNGEVLATTNSDETNEKTIDYYLKKNIVVVNQRNDNLSNKWPQQLVDNKTSILNFNNGVFKRNIVYESSIIEPPIQSRTHSNEKAAYALLSFDKHQYSVLVKNKNLPKYLGERMVELHDTNERSIGFKLLQYSVYGLLYYAYSGLIEKDESPDKYIVINNSPGRIELYTDTSNAHRYFYDNIYTYEQRTSTYTPEKGEHILQKDLERYFGVVLKMDSVDFKCMNIVVEDTTKFEKFTKENNNNYTSEEIVTSDFYKLVNSSLVKLLNFYNNYPGNIKTILIDKTNYPDTSRITIKINSSNRLLNKVTIPILQEELKKYGLNIKTETRKLRVQVIEKSF